MLYLLETPHSPYPFLPFPFNTSLLVPILTVTIQTLVTLPLLKGILYLQTFLLNSFGTYSLIVHNLLVFSSIRFFPYTLDSGSQTP